MIKKSPMQEEFLVKYLLIKVIRREYWETFSNNNNNSIYIVIVIHVENNMTTTTKIFYWTE